MTAGVLPQKFLNFACTVDVIIYKLFGIQKTGSVPNCVYQFGKCQV